MTEPLALPVNVEALVSAFLRDQPEMVELVDDRVYTVIPKPPKSGSADTFYPLVLVTLIIDIPHTGPLWGTSSDVQIDAFGGRKDEARRIAATARALISTRLRGEYPEGVVNGVTNGGMLDLPDESYSPAKPRWLFTSTIHARPLATLPTS